MKQLGKFGKVFYLNPHKTTSQLIVSGTPDHNVFDVSISCSPYFHLTRQKPSQQFRSVSTDISLECSRAASDIASLIPADSEVLLYISAPYWRKIALKLIANLEMKACTTSLVYDILDSVVHFKDLTPHTDKLIDDQLILCNEANLVTYTAKAMADCSPVHDFQNCLYLPNACNPEDWTFSSTIPHINTPHNVIIGYFGTIAHWFNIDLVNEVADSSLISKIQLIGPVTEGALDNHTLSSKIELLGVRKHYEIDQIASHWSCSLIPFKDMELTQFTNPVKLYEYMALGLPVVATPLSEILHVFQTSYKPESLYDPPPAGPFRVKVVNAILNDSTEQRLERREWATTQTWEKRVNSMLNSLPLEWKYD